MGNGQQIDAWRDPWLKKPPSYKATLPRQVTPTSLLVADLLSEGGREWNFEGVRDIFSEEDAAIISGIHLSHRNIPDKLIWKDSSTGVFTVKSAYYVARRILCNEVHPQSLKNRIWSLIWKARVVPKVKFFT